MRRVEHNWIVADERGWHRYPRKTRNLHVFNKARNAPVSRKVGSNREVVEIAPPPPKRATFAAGATYGESWQTKHAEPEARGVTRAATYTHNGQTFDNFDDYCTAVEKG